MPDPCICLPLIRRHSCSASHVSVWPESVAQSCLDDCHPEVSAIVRVDVSLETLYADIASHQNGISSSRFLFVMATTSAPSPKLCLTDLSNSPAIDPLQYLSASATSLSDTSVISGL